MRFEKILCPIDFSPGSTAAMRTAIRIANETDAELELAHVCELPAAAGLTPGFLAELEIDAERFLADAMREATALGAKRISSKLLVGGPWSSIVDLVERDPAINLVVIGTHGRTGISRFLLGSVTERVVRHVPCSVLVVRPGNVPTPYTHVLCPIDFSVDSESATELGGQLVQPDGRITLLHVIEIPYNYLGDRPITDVVQDLERASAQLADKAATLLRAKVSVPVSASTMDARFAGARLLDAIEADPTIDLIVMGSHGRTGIRRALMGSVAEKIVRHARCPVLVARQRDDSAN